jgi:hypothetical protein
VLMDSQTISPSVACKKVPISSPNQSQLSRISIENLTEHLCRRSEALLLETTPSWSSSLVSAIFAAAAKLCAETILGI